jgi:hypothetical protein
MLFLCTTTRSCSQNEVASIPKFKRRRTGRRRVRLAGIFWLDAFRSGQPFTLYLFNLVEKLDALWGF